MHRIDEVIANYLTKDFGAAVVFTILALIVAASGVLTGSTGAAVLLTLAFLLIISTGMLGLFIAVRHKTKITQALWYELFVGFFGALVLVAFILPLFGAPSAVSLLNANSSNLIWNLIILLVAAGVSLFIVELIGYGILVATGKMRR